MAKKKINYEEMLKKFPTPPEIKKGDMVTIKDPKDPWFDGILTVEEVCGEKVKVSNGSELREVDKEQLADAADVVTFGSLF